jgi:hypothetical protein
MGLLQEMKEVKLRYLAEVMGDYAEHLRKTSGNDYVANQIDEWAKEIIDVIEITDEHPVTMKTLNIMKFTKRRKFDDIYHIQGMDIKGFQKCMEDEVVKDLLWEVKKCVKVRTEKEYDRVPVVTASLYVGVEPGTEIKYNE